MNYDQFIGQVQSRARLASRGEAVRAVHATLYTLSERISGTESADLGAQLPGEIAFYLQRDGWRDPESFSLHHFYSRVASREHVDLPEAVFHSRAVIRVLTDAVSKGEIGHVRAQLPSEYDTLFKAAESRSPAADESYAKA